MSIIFTIIAAIFAIFIVVLIHELGHFLVARWCGVKVLKFSIGFGKALWSYRAKSGTEYVIAMLPLGGYVKMLGENDETITPEDKNQAFDQKPLLKRMAITLAGPFFNFILAVIVFAMIYIMGIDYVKPIVGDVIPHSIADQASIKKGDEIIAINGKAISNWQQGILILIEHMGLKKNLIFTVKHSGVVEQKILNISSWKVNQQKMDLFQSLGIVPFYPAITPVVAEVSSGSPAEIAGLRPGDLIVAVNGHAVNEWKQLLLQIENIPNTKVNLSIRRNNIVQQIPLTLGERVLANHRIGYLGVLPVTPQWPAEMKIQKRYNILTAWLPGLKQTAMLFFFNAVVLLKLITGKISVEALSGPVMIFETAGKASQLGLSTYLAFIGFISATLGFVNVLPIPALDGGHFLFQVIEGIIGRPIPQKYQLFALKLGLLLLILLLIQATYNDLFRLFKTF